MKKDDNVSTELEELNNKYLRALADYQNLEKQTQIWREDFVKFANQKIIIDLLEVLDDLEKASEHLADEGLKIIIDKLKKVLKNNGLEEIEAIGKEFDPTQMECVGMEDGEIEGQVLKVVQKGFRIDDKIVRVAKVIVSKK